MELSKVNVFIGLDMVDGCAPYPRCVDIAFLDRTLACTFGTWSFDQKGTGLLPSQLRPPGFILAIDGPQGLAGSPEQRMRECERVGRVPGKCPYQFPPPGRIYSGFITSSIRLFASLWQSGKFHLNGRCAASCKEPNHQATLIEVYPGKAWRDLALPRGMRLAPKHSCKGREQRRDLLKAVGLTLPLDSLPNDDQLDAALAAYIAFLFAEGKTTQQGIAPKWNDANKVLREGFIVYPLP